MKKTETVEHEALREERLVLCNAANVDQDDLLAIEDAFMQGRPVGRVMRSRMRTCDKNAIRLAVARVIEGAKRLSVVDLQRIAWLRLRIEARA